MSEAKRVPLQTLEFPESLGHATKKEKKGDMGKQLAPSFRFTLTLPESNEKTCPEFNYSQLLKSAEVSFRMEARPDRMSSLSHTRPDGKRTRERESRKVRACPSEERVASDTNEDGRPREKRDEDFSRRSTNREREVQSRDAAAIVTRLASRAPSSHCARLASVSARKDLPPRDPPQVLRSSRTAEKPFHHRFAAVPCRAGSAQRCQRHRCALSRGRRAFQPLEAADADGVLRAALFPS